MWSTTLLLLYSLCVYVPRSIYVWLGPILTCWKTEGFSCCGFLHAKSSRICVECFLAFVLRHSYRTKNDTTEQNTVKKCTGTLLCVRYQYPYRYITAERVRTEKRLRVWLLSYSVCCCCIITFILFYFFN